jgi:hypothetical protein
VYRKYGQPQQHGRTKTYPTSCGFRASFNTSSACLVIGLLQPPIVSQYVLWVSLWSSWSANCTVATRVFKRVTLASLLGCHTTVKMKFPTGCVFLVSYLPLLVPAAYLQKRAGIAGCLDSLQVPVYAPASSNYTQAIKPFNLRVPFTPTAYA